MQRRPCPRRANKGGVRVFERMFVTYVRIEYLLRKWYNKIGGELYMYVVVLYGIEVFRTDDREEAGRIYQDCLEGARHVSDAELYEERKGGVRRVY